MGPNPIFFIYPDYQDKFSLHGIFQTLETTRGNHPASHSPGLFRLQIIRLSKVPPTSSPRE